MYSDDGREFLKFVSGLLDFISQYDKARLSRFHTMSLGKFHNVGDIIQGMIELMESPDVEMPKGTPRIDTENVEAEERKAL